MRDKPDFSSLNSAAPMEIIQIPVLTDNYIYLLHDDASGMTAAVDPAEAMPVMEILD
jgi:hydroxyacylglutathione hydrolase